MNTKQINLSDGVQLIGLVIDSARLTADERNIAHSTINALVQRWQSTVEPPASGVAVDVQERLGTGEATTSEDGVGIANVVEFPRG